MKKILSFIISISLLMGLNINIFAYENLVGDEIIILPDSYNVQITSGHNRYIASEKRDTYSGEGTHYVADVSVRIVYTPKIIKGGRYKVEMWNVPWEERNSDAQSIKVYHKNGVDSSFKLPNKTGASKFYEMGEFEFSPGTDGYIEIITGGWFSFDAVRLTLIEENGEIYSEEPGDILQVPSKARDYLKADVPLYEKNVTLPQVKKGAVEIYVENGKNGNGTSANPFGTIQQARDKARTIISGGYPENGIVVWIKGGTYEINESIDFLQADSGKEGNPVIYAGYDGEVNIVSGVRIDRNNVTEISDETKKQLPAAARKNVIAIDLKKQGLESIPYVESATVPFVLSEGETSYTVARYPNGTAQGNMGLIEEYGSNSNSTTAKLRGPTFSMSDPRQLRWGNELSPKLSGMYGPEYGRRMTHISDINTNEMSMSMDLDSWISTNEEASYFAYNLLSELDIPGEFYVDTEKCIMYYYPINQNSAEEMYLAYKDNTVLNIKSAENIAFLNLNIVCGGGTGVYMAGKNNVFAGGTVSGLGGVGADVYGKNNTVRDCDFYNLGASAICLYGGDEFKYIKANNVAENNLVHDVQKGGISGSIGAINVYNCGNSAFHNYVYDVPGIGICLSGCGCVAEWNRVERSCLTVSDTGAIYCYYPRAGFGGKINHNYVRDAQGSEEGHQQANGIYPDDYTCGLEICGNVVINPRGSGVNLRGSDYLVDNNLFIHNALPDERSSTFSSGPGFFFSSVSDYEYLYEQGFDLTVPEFAYMQKDIDSGKYGYVKDIEFTNNITFTDYEFYHGFDAPIIQAFSNPEWSSTMEGSVWFEEDFNGDLEFLTDLDYEKIREQTPGFKDLEVEKMGIYKGGLRDTENYLIPASTPMEFSLISPADGEVRVSDMVELKWDAIQNYSGYGKTTVYIAETSDFSKGLVSFSTKSSSMEIKCDYGKTYYWTVVGDERKTGEQMMNIGGVRSFSIADAETVMNMRLFEAKGYIKSTDTGKRGLMFSNTAKEELLGVVEEIEGRTITDIFEIKNTIKILDEAIEKYKQSKNASQNRVNYIYYDFQTDLLGLQNFLTHSGRDNDKVVVDPVNPLNKVVEFNDVGTGHHRAITQTRRQYSGIVELFVSVMADNNSSCFSVALATGGSRLGNTPAENNILSVNFRKDGKIYGGKTNNYPLCTFEKMKWYDVKIILDCDKDIYDVYVDGEMVGEDIPTEMDVSEKSVGTVKFSTTDGTDSESVISQAGKYYIDNIIYSGPDDKSANSYLYELEIGGMVSDEFMLDNYRYEVNMNEEEFKKAIVLYEADKDASVSVWQKENKKYIVVISGNGDNATVYVIENK